jgi:2-hydroxychromene-2-carboxylate isomerase
MGDLIDLTARRAQREGQPPEPPPTFFFDVSDPLCYLAAEQVERSLGEMQWVAANGAALGDRADEQAALREQAEARAHALRLPLVWPDTFPASTPCALRAAAFACEIGAGPQFALAASRLAFCGGFDLEDPEVLIEAAAAAGIPFDSCLDAAGECWRDEELAEIADRLREHGILELPAVTICGHWVAGDATLQRARAVAADLHRDGGRPAEPGRSHGPLAPVG